MATGRRGTTALLAAKFWSVIELGQTATLRLTSDQDASNTYYRPVLFLTDNATNVDIEGITFLNSPCWTTFLVRTKGVSFDNVYIEAFSNNASVSSLYFMC